MTLESQELHCHNCNNYVQFKLDMGLNGNHVLNCPKCGHQHCRVVKDGKITSERWDSRNRSSYQVNSRYISYSQTSTWASYSSVSSASSDSATSFYYDSWSDSGTGGYY